MVQEMNRHMAVDVEACNVGDLIQDVSVGVKKGYSFVSRPTGETGKFLRGVPLALFSR